MLLDELAVPPNHFVWTLCYYTDIIMNTYKSFTNNRLKWSLLALPGSDSEILKREALYVGHHGWLAKKILDFRWSKKAEIAL